MTGVARSGERWREREKERGGREGGSKRRRRMDGRGKGRGRERGKRGEKLKLAASGLGCWLEKPQGGNQGYCL